MCAEINNLSSKALWPSLQPLKPSCTTPGDNWPPYNNTILSRSVRGHQATKQNYIFCGVSCVAALTYASPVAKFAFSHKIEMQVLVIARIPMISIVVYSVEFLARWPRQRDVRAGRTRATSPL